MLPLSREIRNPRRRPRENLLCWIQFVVLHKLAFLFQPFSLAAQIVYTLPHNFLFYFFSVLYTVDARNRRRVCILYDMTHQQSGLAIIFVNLKFDYETIKERKGFEKDRELFLFCFVTLASRWKWIQGFYTERGR